MKDRHQRGPCSRAPMRLLANAEQTLLGPPRHCHHIFDSRFSKFASRPKFGLAYLVPSSRGGRVIVSHPWPPPGAPAAPHPFHRPLSQAQRR